MLSGQGYPITLICYIHEYHNVLTIIGQTGEGSWLLMMVLLPYEKKFWQLPYTLIACHCDIIKYSRKHYETYGSSVDEDNNHDDNEYNKDDKNDLPFVVLPDDEPECLPWWGKPEEWCCWAVGRIKLGVHVGVISGLACWAQLRLFLWYNLNFKLKLRLNYNGNKIKFIVVCMYNVHN